MNQKNKKDYWCDEWTLNSAII